MKCLNVLHTGLAANLWPNRRETNLWKSLNRTSSVNIFLGCRWDSSYFVISVLFVKQCLVPRDADDELVSHCSSFCFRRWMCCLFLHNHHDWLMHLFTANPICFVQKLWQAERCFLCELFAFSVSDLRNQDDFAEPLLIFLGQFS